MVLNAKGLQNIIYWMTKKIISKFQENKKRQHKGKDDKRNLLMSPE